MLSKRELDIIRDAINHGDTDYKIIGNKAYMYNLVFDEWEEVLSVSSGSGKKQSLKETMKKGGVKLKNKRFSITDEENIEEEGSIDENT